MNQVMSAAFFDEMEKIASFFGRVGRFFGRAKAAPVETPMWQKLGLPSKPPSDPAAYRKYMDDLGEAALKKQKMTETAAVSGHLRPQAASAPKYDWSKYNYQARPGPDPGRLPTAQDMVDVRRWGTTVGHAGR